jgi:hypothetical protein
MKRRDLMKNRNEGRHRARTIGRRMRGQGAFSCAIVLSLTETTRTPAKKHGTSQKNKPRQSDGVCQQSEAIRRPPISL